MKQIDRIRNVDIDRLAVEIANLDDEIFDKCSFCLGCNFAFENDITCREAIKAWLESEVEE